MVLLHFVCLGTPFAGAIIRNGILARLVTFGEAREMVLAQVELEKVSNRMSKERVASSCVNLCYFAGFYKDRSLHLQGL